MHVGLDASRIKLAMRWKLEQTGLPFTTPDALIEAVLRIQMNEDSSSSSSDDSMAGGLSRARSTDSLFFMSNDIESEEEGQDTPTPKR
jgi:hypothetical protein